MDDLKWLLDKAWILLGGLMAWIFQSHRTEIAEIKAALATKADADEMDRQRDNITKLFESQVDLRNQMNGGFQSIRDLIHEGQIAIIREIASKADK